MAMVSNESNGTTEGSSRQQLSQKTPLFPIPDPKDRIKLGMVGLNFGRKLIESNFRNGPASTFFDLSAVCDLNQQRANAVGEELGVSVHHSLESLLEDPDISALALITGPAKRAKYIRQIIESGKDVMTTKPLELDSSAALQVLQLARELGRVVHLNSPAPFPSPDLSQILEWQSSHELGRPIAARADVWASYREEADGSWYDDPELCPAAPIFRLGIYLINDLIRLIGNPVSVSVMESRILTGRPTSDSAQLSLRFENDALATIFGSFCVNDGHWWRNSLTLNYENGTVYRNVGPTWGFDPRFEPELELVTYDGTVQQVKKKGIKGSSEDYQWGAFYQAIQGQPQRGELGPEQMAISLRVIEAMKRAIISKKIEEV